MGWDTAFNLFDGSKHLSTLHGGFECEITVEERHAWNLRVRDGGMYRELLEHRIQCECATNRGHTDTAMDHHRQMVDLNRILYDDAARWYAETQRRRIDEKKDQRKAKVGLAVHTPVESDGDDESSE